MAGNPPFAQSRVGDAQCVNQCCQNLILGIFVGLLIGAFQFNPNAEVIAVLLSPVARDSGMPGPAIKGDKLGDSAVTLYQHMCRHPLVCYGCKKGMCVGLKLIGKQLCDVGSPELAGGQTYVVEDNQ